MDINANRFLSSFTKIEKELQRKLKVRSSHSFSENLKQLEKLPVIRKFNRELRNFGDLRNAIVHSYYRDKVLAVPVLHTVESIENIENKICSPKKVFDVCNTDIETVTVNENLDIALKKMYRSELSQLPIVKDYKVLEILNTNTIARWLAANLLVDISETKIAQLIPYIEYPLNFSFTDKNTDIYDAASLLSSNKKITPLKDALLISENGANDSQPIGIVVSEDLAKEGAFHFD